MVTVLAVPLPKVIILRKQRGVETIAAH